MLYNTEYSQQSQRGWQFIFLKFEPTLLMNRKFLILKKIIWWNFFCMQTYVIIVRKFFWLSVWFWTKILAETERLNDTKTETKMRTKTEILTETNTETESFRLLIVSHFFACLNFFGPLIHGLIVKFNSNWESIIINF